LVVTSIDSYIWLSVFISGRGEIVGSGKKHRRKGVKLQHTAYRNRKGSTLLNLPYAIDHLVILYEGCKTMEKEGRTRRRVVKSPAPAKEQKRNKY
jgi:hypothetical protein